MDLSLDDCNRNYEVAMRVNCMVSLLVRGVVVSMLAIARYCNDVQVYYVVHILVSNLDMVVINY